MLTGLALMGRDTVLARRCPTCGEMVGRSRVLSHQAPMSPVHPPPTGALTGTRAAPLQVCPPHPFHQRCTGNSPWQSARTAIAEFRREAVGLDGRELREELALNSSELRLSEASLRPLLMELLSSQLEQERERESSLH